MKKQASDYRLVPRSGGRGRMEKSNVKHKNRAAFKLAPMGRWAGAGWRSVVLYFKKSLSNREDRENRSQLRCGNVSQTPIRPEWLEQSQSGNR